MTSTEATPSMRDTVVSLGLHPGAVDLSRHPSIALSTGYNSHASQARTFAATITWTQSTKTLVITLGDNGTGGTRGDNVPASLPVYTPPAGAADLAGNPMTGTSPATTASRF